MTILKHIKIKKAFIVLFFGAHLHHAIAGREEQEIARNLFQLYITQNLNTQEQSWQQFVNNISTPLMRKKAENERQILLMIQGLEQAGEQEIQTGEKNGEKKQQKHNLIYILSQAFLLEDLKSCIIDFYNNKTPKVLPEEAEQKSSNLVSKNSQTNTGEDVELLTRNMQEVSLSSVSEEQNISKVKTVDSEKKAHKKPKKKRKKKTEDVLDLKKDEDKVKRTLGFSSGENVVHMTHSKEDRALKQSTRHLNLWQNQGLQMLIDDATLVQRDDHFSLVQSFFEKYVRCCALLRSSKDFFSGFKNQENTNEIETFERKVSSGLSNLLSFKSMGKYAFLYERIPVFEQMHVAVMHFTEMSQLSHFAGLKEEAMRAAHSIEELTMMWKKEAEMMKSLSLGLEHAHNSSEKVHINFFLLSQKVEIERQYACEYALSMLHFYYLYFETLDFMAQNKQNALNQQPLRIEEMLSFKIDDLRLQALIEHDQKILIDILRFKKENNFAIISNEIDFEKYFKKFEYLCNKINIETLKKEILIDFYNTFYENQPSFCRHKWMNDLKQLSRVLSPSCGIDDFYSYQVSCSIPAAKKI